VIAVIVAAATVIAVTIVFTCASDARVIAIIACLSVCLSLAGIVPEWLNVGSRKQHHMISQGV